MPNRSPSRLQAAGVTIVILALLGVVVYGRRWNAFGGSFPYVVGLFCTALAVTWALYDRT
jgi:hypothetical protein